MVLATKPPDLSSTDNESDSNLTCVNFLDKLFFVRGSSPSESCVIEVPRDNRSLNSLGCYVYCCEAEQTVYAWRGASSSRAQNACLERAVEKMAVR